MKLKKESRYWDSFFLAQIKNDKNEKSKENKFNYSESYLCTMSELNEIWRRNTKL